MSSSMSASRRPTLHTSTRCPFPFAFIQTHTAHRLIAYTKVELRRLRRGDLQAHRCISKWVCTDFGLVLEDGMGVNGKTTVLHSCVLQTAYATSHANSHNNSTQPYDTDSLPSGRTSYVALSYIRSLASVHNILLKSLNSRDVNEIKHGVNSSCKGA